MAHYNFTSDIAIGLEIHITLDTNSKLFCGCASKPAGNETGSYDGPNTRICPVCLGHPGSKPVLNKKAVDYALRLCSALKCRISPELIFSRKTYFYPDMAKNYQITQYEIPLGTGGKLRLGSGKEISITRVHIEEDPASLVHEGSHCLVDYNRSGVPLCEIVTEPELTSPEEAREFMKRLIAILQYLEIFESSAIIKADANISIKGTGYVRQEIKNITGFKEIERALSYEVGRQKKLFSEGRKLAQSTLGWDSGKGTTFMMRSKETEEDYGYILDSDLVKTEITGEWLSDIQKEMPELPEDKKQKFISRHGISPLDAEVISQEKKLACMFEKIAEEIDPMLAAKWLRRELVRVMNFNRQAFNGLLIDESHMIELLSMVEKKEITEQTAQKILEKLAVEPFSPIDYVKKNKLQAVSDTKELEKICIKVIDENLKVAEDYKKGNEKSLHFLVGQVMRNTKSKADPKIVNELLKRYLKTS